jgi:hypothetical protein
MTVPVHTVADPIDLPGESCSVCRHPMTAHDPIAGRYCRATLTNAISRNCICSSVGK